MTKDEFDKFEDLKQHLRIEQQSSALYKRSCQCCYDSHAAYHEGISDFITELFDKFPFLKDQ